MDCYFNSKEVNKDGENFNFNINLLRSWVRLMRIAIDKKAAFFITLFNLSHRKPAHKAIASFLLVGKITHIVCRKCLLNLRQTITHKVIKTVEVKVLTEIQKAKKGTVFFVESLLHIANAKAVSKALERLVAKGEIVRVATGIYVRPKQSKLLGNMIPTVEEIAKAIAKRDKARIVATGIFALNALGLSTQVPLNAVYLTDGAARKIMIGKRSILFKKTTPKNLAAIGQISKLVIQALKTIGFGKVEPHEEKKILGLLKKEKQKHLEHDIALAPEWIRKIMRKALKSNLR